MIDLLQPYFPYYPPLLAAILALSVLLLLIALYNLRRQRTAAVWRVRHDSGKRGSKLLFTSLTMMISTLFVGVISGVAIVALGYENEFFPPRSPYDVVGVSVADLPTPTDLPRHTATPTATLADAVIVTAVLPVTATPTVTASQTPTATDPPPTATATAVPPTNTQQAAVFPTNTTVPTATTIPTLTLTPTIAVQSLPPGVALRVIAIDDQLSANQTPVNPRLRFAAGVQQLYFFISYSGMTDGTSWSRVIYQEGEPILGGASAWTWGTEGANFFTLRSQGGFAPGDYEIRLYLDGGVAHRAAFTVE